MTRYTVNVQFVIDTNAPDEEEAEVKALEFIFGYATRRDVERINVEESDTE